MNAVQLREVRDEDLLIHFANQQDPVATAMAAFPPRDWDAFVAHWTRIRADEAVTIRTVLLGEEVVGSVASFVRSGQRLVGYWIGRAYWGRGIATRALTALLECDPSRPLYAHVAKHNHASRRVLEKCGFRVCGEELCTRHPGYEVEEWILKLD